jgi:hypothetical protein
MKFQNMVKTKHESCSALHLNSYSSRMSSGSLDVLYVVMWRPLADSLSAMHISVSACLQSFTVKKQRTKMHDFTVCIGIYSGLSFQP